MKLSNTLVSIALLSSLLTACGGGDSDHDFSQPAPPPEGFEVALPHHGPIFDPAAGKIPTTNDLLFKDSVDGTLNIPNPDNNPVVAAANELDGFSTSIPITADFGMPLKQASLILGQTIRVFEVTKNAQGAVTGVLREVTNAEMVAAASGEKGTTLALVPKVPLKESTSYLVVLTNGITDAAGVMALTPSAYSLARSTTPLTASDFEALEPLRQLINNMEDIAVSQGVDKSKIILSWSFTTQSITAVLNDVAASAKAGNIQIVPMGVTTNAISSSLPGIADVYFGTLDIPYYLDKDAPLTAYWKGAGGTALTRYNTTPVKTTTLTVPVTMTMPNKNSGHEMPKEGWPIVMYQHGITRLRTDMLGYADAMASAGFAVIAMDLPLHGITSRLSADGNPNPFHAANTPFPNDIEPTFDIDFLDNATNTPVEGGDGIIDDSGENFIVLTSLLTSRDNTRQGVSNLLVLRRSLENIDNIDADKVGFVAHSLGGIIGVPYLGVESKSMPTSLVTTGASISTILRDSATYGPIVKEGLEALGVTGEDYLKFLAGTQWIVDSADPVNYAIDAAMTHPIHMIKVIDDGTVPNSSTEILTALVGATKAADPINDVSIGKAKIATFTEGNHSSILDPTRGGDFLNVFTEMHSQLVKFQATAGTKVIISDLDIIEK